MDLLLKKTNTKQNKRAKKKAKTSQKPKQNPKECGSKNKLSQREEKFEFTDYFM